MACVRDAVTLSPSPHLQSWELREAREAADRSAALAAAEVQVREARAAAEEARAAAEKAHDEAAAMHSAELRPGASLGLKSSPGLQQAVCEPSPSRELSLLGQASREALAQHSGESPREDGPCDAQSDCPGEGAACGAFTWDPLSGAAQGSKPAAAAAAAASSAAAETAHGSPHPAAALVPASVASTTAQNPSKALMVAGIECGQKAAAAGAQWTPSRESVALIISMCAGEAQIAAGPDTDFGQQREARKLMAAEAVYRLLLQVRPLRSNEAVIIASGCHSALLRSRCYGSRLRIGAHRVKSRSS